MAPNPPATESYSIEPTHADLSYGPHERHVLDYWAPAPGNGIGDGPGAAPLLIHVHGGGFMAGDKTRIRTGAFDLWRDAGYALASINYRLSHQANAPAFMIDGARAVQFLRAHAAELGFDPERVGMSGSSAGAGISLWVAFHDDLAEPDSPDPVARQSTRINCVVIRSGQCSYDPRLFRKLGLEAAIDHPFIEPFYGLTRDQFDTPEAHAAFDAAAAVTHVKPGAPPVYSYHTGSMDPVPAADGASAGANLPSIAVHHPRLSMYLKEKLEAVGTECIVEAGVEEGEALDRRVFAFLQRHLT